MALNSSRDFEVENGIRVTDTTRPYEAFPKWVYFTDRDPLLCESEADVPKGSYEHQADADAAKAEAAAKAAAKA